MHRSSILVGEKIAHGEFVRNPPALDEAALNFKCLLRTGAGRVSAELSICVKFADKNQPSDSQPEPECPGFREEELRIDQFDIHAANDFAWPPQDSWTPQNEERRKVADPAELLKYRPGKALKSGDIRKALRIAANDP